MLQVIGDSHCVPYLQVLADANDPITKAVKARFGEFRGCQLYGGPNFSQENYTVLRQGIKFIDRPMVARLRVAGCSPFINAKSPSMIVFTSGFINSAVIDESLWKEFTTEPSDRSRSFLSVGVMRAMFARHAAPLAMLAALKRTNNNVAFIEAAPLYRSYLDKIEDKSMISPILRAQSMFRNFHRRELDLLGIPVVKVPQRMIDRGGLKANFEGRYNERDITHGGPAFAREMLRDFLRQFGAASS